MTPAKDPFVGEGEDWQADFESHGRWQLTSALATTPAQRLAWLEEARLFAYRSGALPRAGTGSDLPQEEE